MKEPVKLTEAEEQHVHIFVHRGKANARTITRARVLLNLSEGWSDEQITAAFDICRATFSNIRKRCWEYHLRQAATTSASAHS
jgi:uncharacterized protein (DUF433 family)